MHKHIHTHVYAYTHRSAYGIVRKSTSMWGRVRPCHVPLAVCSHYLLACWHHQVWDAYQRGFVCVYLHSQICIHIHKYTKMHRYPHWDGYQHARKWPKTCPFPKWRMCIITSTGVACQSVRGDDSAASPPRNTWLGWVWWTCFTVRRPTKVLGCDRGFEQVSYWTKATYVAASKTDDELCNRDIQHNIGGGLHQNIARCPKLWLVPVKGVKTSRSSSIPKTWGISCLLTFTSMEERPKTCSSGRPQACCQTRAAHTQETQRIRPVT
jgi:hypothetical protein